MCVSVCVPQTATDRQTQIKRGSKGFKIRGSVSGSRSGLVTWFVCVCSLTFSHGLGHGTVWYCLRSVHRIHST